MSARARVLDKLAEIERNYNVKIVYACESGSRAWGTHTAKSDYDIRFIYVFPPTWYLSIREKKRLAITPCNLPRDFDVQGWELGKALRLLRASNPSLLECLASPVVYISRHVDASPCDDQQPELLNQDSGTVHHQLRALAHRYFSARACMHHYVSWARSTHLRHAAEPPSLKRLLHVVRALLAARHVEQTGKPVPVCFNELLCSALGEKGWEEVSRAVHAFLEERRAGGEQIVDGGALRSVTAFVEDELGRQRDSVEGEGRKTKCSDDGIDEMDALFRRVILSVWR